MTMIAALRSYEGAIICADTQETRNDYRVTIDKIDPTPIGNYEVVIGGAGNVAGLIDGFITTLLFDVERWSAGLGEEVVYQSISSVLNDYYNTTVRSHPAESERKDFEIIYCIRDTTRPKLFLFKSQANGLSRIADYAVVGIEAEIYDHKLQTLYRAKAGGNHALYMAIHLLAFGEAIFSIVRGEKVIRITEYGMKVESAEDVRELKDRLVDFETLIGRLVLNCPDTSIPRDEFRVHLLQTVDWIMDKREAYMSKHMPTPSPPPILGS